jgi:hypothetical protein
MYVLNWVWLPQIPEGRCVKRMTEESVMNASYKIVQLRYMSGWDLRQNQTGLGEE